MAPRAAKISSAGLGPDVIADIAADTDGYQARLAAFREAEAKAETAAAIARDRQAAAERAAERSREMLQELADRTAAIDARQAAVAAREAELTKRAADLDAYAERTTGLERSVRKAEGELVQKREAALNAVKMLLS